MVLKEEVFNFFKNLNVIMTYGKDLILMDKNSPRIYKIPKEIFLNAKDNLQINPALIKDYANLKRWSYLPDPGKAGFYNNSSAPKLSLRVSEDCTLACKYCFSKNNMLNSKRIKYMTKETGVKALNFFLSHFKTKSAWLIFFGGEPMMNFPLMKYMTDYAKKNIKGTRFEFNITTNGTIMNKDIIRWILENDIPVTVSLDFPMSEHNRNRPFIDGRSSFEGIKKKLSPLKIPEKENLLSFLTIC